MRKQRIVVSAIIPFIALIMIIGISSNSFAGDKDAAYLGVNLTDLDDDLRETLNFKGDGAFVKEVVEDSPADEAGLKDGDIIIEFNGKKVAGETKLVEMIKSHKPGDKVKFIVSRDGKEKTLKVKLGKSKGIEKEIVLFSSGSKKHKKMCCKSGDFNFCHTKRGYMGVKLQDMSDQLREYFGVINGALIGEVLKDTPAEKAGLMAGDVIVEFDGRRVDNNEDLHYFLKKSKPEKEFNLVVSRKGTNKNFTIKLGEYPKGCQSKNCNMIELKCMEGELGNLEIELDNLEGCLEELDKLKPNSVNCFSQSILMI